MILFTRIFMAISFSCLVGFYFHRAWGLERGNDFSAQDRLFGRDRRDKIIHVGFFPLILPLSLGIIFAGIIWKFGLTDGISLFFRFSISLLWTMSVYYIALLFLMPLLRRHISARACAVAWLFPTLLYYVGYNFAAITPLAVFYCPKRLLDALIPVWFGGFILVFGASILSHLRFRRKVMRTAREECDASVLQIWQEESEQLGFKNPIRLVRYEPAKTPFSMGDSKRTRVTVLPMHSYTQKELRLIFRHELHHLQRNDADSKCFFSFLLAFFWFHPLMWLALREASRDIELSCDEIVLETADDDDRKLYADLLLNTAGERHGFTTCMSADASSLRYRLRNVMKKQRRPAGTLLLMVLLFTCLMFHGVLAVSDERLTLGEVFSLESVNYWLYQADDELYRSDADLTPGNREALLSYLETLPIEHLNDGRYSAASEQVPRLYFSSDKTRQCLWLGNGSIVIYDLDHLDSAHSTVYYVREDVDWEKIEACFQ